jgi:hypothetical protein
MNDIPRLELARRAGVEPALVDRLVELGILVPGSGDVFSTSDARRARFMQTLRVCPASCGCIRSAARVSAAAHRRDMG